MPNCVRHKWESVNGSCPICVGEQELQKVARGVEPIGAKIAERLNYDENFLIWFDVIAKRAYQHAVDKGFHNGHENVGEKFMLQVTEIAEAFESTRSKTPVQDEHCPDFLNVEIEQADLVIRAMDLCVAKGWRLGEAILAKMAYNRTRPHMHGKNC